ncbi:flagellar hook-length control protein FliK [Bradyrhizobium jicamae]|uniref:flagellar hook-length control protein FliK n=1 Tax=Bradyrhizobium jicamae TaxID=280332 RepID=UPI001BA8268D|nr:flagellar hook-length control protein FliK [Bradyrhizobium jicamae]MBR0753614.1 flagellar hook-length control protein FliK [Bradyrhizobium jicamae]
MAISIHPVLPVLASQEAASIAPELVLQQGSVVNAQVLQVLSADLVRIAIQSLSIDVQTEVPLQAGQQLQLAVSQGQDGSTRLQLVGQGADAGGVSPDAITLSPKAQVDAPLSAQPAAPVQKAVLTPLERVVVTAAAQGAATIQDSQAPLFANLNALATSPNLPPKLQAAIAQVLAQQTSLDPQLDGGDIKAAFQKSGLFLEASLATGTVPSSSGVLPDLKAALIVLKQTLSSLGATEAGQAPAAPVAQDAALPRAAATTAAITLAPAPEADLQEILLPQARVPVADDVGVASSTIANALAEALDSGPSSGGALNLLQEALQELGTTAATRLQPAAPRAVPLGDTVHTNTPPPPFRGALPTAQPIAAPSIAPDAPLAATTHHLLENTDAAIARQTLLQVASLPDRVDATAQRIDITTPRWNFEIPFLTPQGTAIAQFEVSRDGGGEAAEAGKRVWKARFSLDVEPTGPVHALISLVGDRTSVRMWAERPSTAAQLRAGAAELSQQLAQAELNPGDIVIRDGTPPQAIPARAGHFLDRAL